jgi:hypothetical protein
MDFKNVFNNLNLIVNAWKSGNNNSKNYVLDPMTCLIRLGVIYYQAESTKISIYQNRISYNDL